MKKLQLEVNNKIIQIPLSESIIHLILMAYGDEVDLYLTSSTVFASKTWYKGKVEKDDSVSIFLLECPVNSEPLEIKNRSDEDLLKEYKSLKAILTEQKLI